MIWLFLSFEIRMARFLRKKSDEIKLETSLNT